MSCILFIKLINSTLNWQIWRQMILNQSKSKIQTHRKSLIQNLSNVSKKVKLKVKRQDWFWRLLQKFIFLLKFNIRKQIFHNWGNLIVLNRSWFFNLIIVCLRVWQVKIVKLYLLFIVLLVFREKKSIRFLRLFIFDVFRSHS